MRIAKKKLAGFDYRSDKPAELTIKEWTEEFRRVILHGGRRRHEDGETFAYGQDARIVFEVYGYVPEPKL